MIEIYKIFSGKYDISAADFMKLSSDHTERTGNRGNSKKLYIQNCNTNLRKNSFAIRSARVWNSLPDQVINANSVNTFKNRLDKFWKNQDRYLSYRSNINTNTTGNRELYDNDIDEDSDEEAL